MRYLLGFVFVVLATLALLATYSSSSYYRAVLVQEKTILLEPGTGAEEILEQLHAEGALPEPWKIALPVFLRKQYREFKAGEYTFAGGMTPEQILDKIARGEVVVHKVTIPEGFTVTQALQVLLKAPLLSGEVPSSVPEGRLYPDTYHFQRNERRDVIVNRMTHAMEATLAERWAKRAPNLPLHSPEEALVLASIIEKETSVPAERPIVAGVYINRLRQGMKLQADPTVVYGINPSGELGRELTTGDLNRDTPYNTYTRVGLPPSPICNPGAASIAAALNPAVTDALYFVADGKGGHTFAATLAEHQKNVAAYRRLTQPAKAPEPLAAPIKKRSGKNK